MGRRSHNSHWPSGARKNVGTSVEARVALCGNDYFMATFAGNVNQIGCGKCASIILQRWIDAYNAVPANKSLVLERVVDPKAYTKGGFQGHRYAYKALYGGEHVAYVLMEGGYANTHWRLAAIGLEEKKDTAKRGGYISDADYKQLEGKEPKSYDYDAKEFVCKEKALLAVPQFIAVKKLRTLPQTIRDRDDWQAHRARVDARIAAEDAAEEAERDAALEGLLEIRGVNALSDKARTGLEYAIKQLSKKGANR